MIKINGVSVDADQKTIAQYLETTDFDPQRIAVERNGDIVFKSEYETTVLQDGDTVEIVGFVGGG